MAEKENRVLSNVQDRVLLRQENVGTWKSKGVSS